MTTKTIDLLNIALMLLACLLAFFIPFELFLFSYAILGPLHYLTEISWLQKRNYFATGKKDYLLLAVLVVPLTTFFILGQMHNETVIKPLYEAALSLFGPWVFVNAYVFIFLAFAAAFGMVVFRSYFYKTMVVVAAILVGVALQRPDSALFTFEVFLPTLVHVFVFTGLFILFGALKNKSKTGVASLVVFCGCALSFFVIFPNFQWYSVTHYSERALTESGFMALNLWFMNLFKMGDTVKQHLFTDERAIAVMRFIAFAYTYHYLNWFSKTSVIKWHEVSKRRLSAVAGLWIGSIALYAYDYRIGMAALYFLSMLHVVFEFPLNYRSAIGIGEELLGWMGLRQPAKPVRVMTAAKAMSARGAR